MGKKMEETLNNPDYSAWNQSILLVVEEMDPVVEEMDPVAAGRTALVEEIVESMNELKKRNEEKRKAIVELQSRIEKLSQENKKYANENRALKIKLKSGSKEEEKNCSAKYSKNQRTSSQLARLKRLILGSLLGGGSV